MVTWDRKELQVFKTIINNNKSSTIGLEDSPCYSRNLSSYMHCPSFSMNEKYLAFADGNKGIFIHDLDDNKEDDTIDF